MSNNITVIIPIHELSDNLEDYLKKSVLSVAEQTTLPTELLIVSAKNKELKTFLNKFDFGAVKDITRSVENDNEDTSFQSQINYGVNESNTPYFTFLEYDDELSKIWIKNGGAKKINIYY